MRMQYLFPAIPVVALLLMPFLPFVNTSALWLGLPRMFVWGGIWCLLLTPALLLAERWMVRGQGGDQE
jgi:hypothetical protein